MWDDAFDDFWYVGTSKKKPGKFFTYDERGGSILLERSGEFEDYLYKQKLSPSTIRTYPADVADFHDWMQDTYHGQLPRHLYREHVIKYRDHLVARRVKPQTINHKLSALRKYNAFLIASKYQRNEVFKRGDLLKVRPKKLKAFRISDRQISNFLAKVRKTGHERDIALVTLLAYTGMTLQEALDLNPFDLNWKEKQVTVYAGDKKKQRTIPLHDQAVAALEAYQKIRHIRYPNAFCFFAGQGGWKLNPSTVNRLFQKHSKTITPKTLRQCFQVDQLEQGATVAEVVQLTGADPQTVSGWVKRQADDLRKRVNARQL
jgi:site-specific recombinase XerD